MTKFDPADTERGKHELEAEAEAHTVEVEMTETVTYRAEIPFGEFAAMVLEHPDGVTPEALRTYIDEHPSGDYGVEDADGLLDHMLDNFEAVNDRSWSISVGG